MIGPANMATIGAIEIKNIAAPRLTLDEREDDVLESSSPFNATAATPEAYTTRASHTSSSMNVKMRTLRIVTAIHPKSATSSARSLPLYLLAHVS